MFLNYGIENLLLYLFLSAGVHHSDCQVCPQHTCNWTTSEENSFPLCYCDQVCHVYGDCCKDAPGVMDTDDGQNTSVASILRFDDRYCLPLPQTVRLGFRVVNKCNDISCFSDPLKIRSFLPVTIATGTTFLNAECARCNGQSNFRFWDIVFNPNEFEAVTALQNENITNDDIIELFLRSKSIKYQFIFNVNNMTLPRLCIDILHEDISCPKYLSPLTCGRFVLKNLQCALKNERKCSPICLPQLHPFINFISKSTHMSVLLRFRENDNLEGEDINIYSMKIRNTRVNLVVSYWSDSLLSNIKITRFLGALYVSLQHHSGYKFMSVLPKAPYQIETRNCTSYKLCYKYSFYFMLKVQITKDRGFVQNLPTMNVTLRYVDNDLGFKIPIATLTVKNILDRINLGHMWFPLYFSMSGNFRSLSEMRKCKILSITATIKDEELKADVVTRCTQRLSESNGQAAINSKGYVRRLSVCSLSVCTIIVVMLIILCT